LGVDRNRRRFAYCRPNPFILGLCAGNWDTYFEPIKYIIIGWYVISMVAVLIRIGVYRVGILRERERLKNSENQKSKDNS